MTEIQIPPGSALIESKAYAQGCTWCRCPGGKYSAYQPCHFKSASRVEMWGQTQTTQNEPRWVLFMVRNRERGDSHWVFLLAGFLWVHTPSTEVWLFDFGSYFGNFFWDPRPVFLSTPRSLYQQQTWQQVAKSHFLSFFIEHKLIFCSFKDSLLSSSNCRCGLSSTFDQWDVHQRVLNDYR